MIDQLTIHHLFRFEDGSTAFACDRPAVRRPLSNLKARIVSRSGEIRQELVLAGEMKLLRQSRHLEWFSPFTRELVDLTPEEAESGNWYIEV